MINHHPDANMLVEYANGSLPWALCISVAAHLQLCPKCRAQYSQLCSLGGAYLSEAESEPVEDDSFSRLMGRIDANDASANAFALDLSDDPESAKEASSPARELPSKHLPKVIKKLVTDELRWRKIAGPLKAARLATGQDDYEVSFHRIAKGGKVVEHDHKGIEVTLVLEGSFSDKDGVYRRGDFLVREPGQIHRPTATLDQDCLCFSVCEAPVAVTGWLGKVVNPFLSIHPS
ncbi:MAG TPA: ChrR family anti-sigma-E factor [Marinagarivorans sp.]